jgi:hypothetical protein
MAIKISVGREFKKISNPESQVLEKYSLTGKESICQVALKSCLLDKGHEKI